MTYYIKQGDIFKPSSEASLDIRNELPVGNYTIGKDMYDNFFFQTVDSFTLPNKRYGDNTKYSERIFNTFVKRENATGVLLTGEKGSGKSLLAKCLSSKAAENNIPTIIINAPWHGDGFNNLIQSIQQPCVILFDEFEKVYDSQQQEAVLTLLDGTFPSKKLFVLTCNDQWRIDSNMRNRPGRIFYSIEFKGLSVEFIKEYCEDKLENKTHIETLCKVSTLYEQFNFDMLQGIVEDMNRYDESPQEALQLLNAKPEYSNKMSFTCAMSLNGRWLEQKEFYSNGWQGNPLSSRKSIEYLRVDEDGDEFWDNYEQFEHNDLINVDATAGTFTFKNNNGNVLILTKKTYAKHNFFDAF